MIAKLILGCFGMVSGIASDIAGGQALEVFPSSPYDRYIVYETLVLFWIGIIGLIAIIRMKLKEIERGQNMGLSSNGWDRGIKVGMPKPYDIGKRDMTSFIEEGLSPVKKQR
ncbi:MAG TPA: hypothetical protein VMT62_18070 [Syntrophorhabdaceae bacterium]|nr:hypothetical protein [Syntrophorhabdaceae bacterium]